MTIASRLGSRLLVPLTAVSLAGGCVIKPKVIQSPVSNDATNGLTVVGYGEVKALPDQATVVFGVKERNDVAAAAMQAVQAKVVKMLAAIERLGIDRSDITTNQLTLHERYEGQGRRPFFRGEPRPEPGQPPPKKFYEGVYTVEVLVKDLSKVSTLLAAVQDEGVNRISSVKFSVKDSEPKLEQARKLAVDNAMAQAKSLAANAGQELGEILSIATNWDATSSFEAVGHMMAAGMTFDSERSQKIPIRPGEMKFKRTVRMRFTLKK